MPNYNRIAWIYSFLLKLVFGNRQYVANTEYIGEIPSDARVLVVGGGTGKIIECLDKLNKNLELDYVEISSNMLDRSKKRVHKTLKLKFHHQPILNFSLKGYDVIITNFFFDQFSQKLGQEIAMHLSTKLNRHGFIIFSDFVFANNLWDRFISLSTISFFRITANLKINRLPDYEEQFNYASLKQVKVSKTSRNMIAAILSPI